MKVPCYQCNTTTEVAVAFEVKNFACPNCQSLYDYHNGGLRFERKFSHKKIFDHLKIGQSGMLRGKKYTVVALVVKKVYRVYFWKEYTLQDEQGNFIYLSETDGHWILLKKSDKQYEVSGRPKVLRHNGMVLDLYEATHAEIVTAQGYFDLKLPKGKIWMAEFINPPYILSVEDIPGANGTYFGEHISRSEIKKAFSGTSLPHKSGVGIVQPFLFPLKQTVIIFCVVAILMLISHGFIYANQNQTDILREDLTFTASNNKEVVSKSFELQGGSAPMTISVSSNVDNSWANVQLALVNENTGEERYASKDIEYYHGYSGGENWTEGSTQEEFNICGVSQGRYHIVITPQKAPEDFLNDRLSVQVVWNTSSMSNVWMVIFFMGILSAALYFLNKYFEQQRWADSDNSPYNN
ncbi:DUF4178 domain-containing protein [Flavobacterium suncheonense]|uniref:DUF4178 domain-containing protein n=1 Tax=Flavobacterium suncheonense TaxID=350894 RepID=UPI003FA3D079